MFDGNIGMGYDIGWSVFDFFMKTHPQAMKFLEPWSTTAPYSAPVARQWPGSSLEQAINRNWQGGTALLERLAFVDQN